MAVRDIQAFLRQRAAVYDPGLDTGPGSPFDTQVIQPMVTRLGTDPFTVDLTTFIQARLSQAFPDLATSEGDAITDMLLKPASLIWDPIVREVFRVRQGLSFKNASQLTIEEAEALGGNLFSDRRVGAYARGVARILFSQAQNISISPINFFRSKGGLRFFPTQIQSIRTEEMLLNVDKNGLFYFDVNVTSESAGTEYNIEPNSLVSIANVAAASRVVNIRKFSYGAKEDTAEEFISRVKGDLTERTMTTLRGFSSQVTKAFPEVLRLNIAGYNDPEMNRDVISGGGLGPIISSGVSGVVDDDGDNAALTSRLRDEAGLPGAVIDQTDIDSYVITVFDAFAAGEPVGQDLNISRVISDAVIEVDEQVFLPGISGAPSTGTVNTADVAALVESEAFTLDDGVNPPVTYEIDKVGDGVGPLRVQVDVSTLTTSAEVRDALVAAINGSLIDVVASPNGPTKVRLVNDRVGLYTNKLIIVAAAGGLSFVGMGGGFGVDRVRWTIRRRELSLSGIPGGILFPSGPNGDVVIEQDAVHIGGATDVHIRSAGFDDEHLVIDVLADDVPEADGTGLIVDGTPNVVLSDLVLGANYSQASDVFQVLKNAPIQSLTLQIIDGTDAGLYRILTVTQISGQSPVITTDPPVVTTDPILRTWRVFDDIHVDLTEPKKTKVSASDLLTTQNLYEVVSSDGVDFAALGVVQGDTLRILEGPDSGDYSITAPPSGTNNEKLTLNSKMGNTGSSFGYIVFRENQEGGIVLPLVRLTSLELLDSSSQPLGTFVPYAKPIDIQSRAFQNPARGIKHLLNDLRLGLVMLPTGLAAVGSLTVVPGSLGALLGSTFTLDDGLGSPVIFEYTTGASVGTNVPVLYTLADTVVQIHALTAAAINASGIEITAGGSSPIVDLQATFLGDGAGTGPTTTVLGGGSPLIATGMELSNENAYDIAIGDVLDIQYYGLEGLPVASVTAVFPSLYPTKLDVLDLINAAILAATGFQQGAVSVGEGIGIRPFYAGAVCTGTAVRALFGNDEAYTTWDVRSDEVDSLGTTGVSGWGNLSPAVDYVTGLDVFHITSGVQQGFYDELSLNFTPVGSSASASTGVLTTDPNLAATGIPDAFVVRLGTHSFNPEIGVRGQIGARSLGSVRCFFLEPTSATFGQDSRFTLTTGAGVLNFLPDPSLSAIRIPPPPETTKPSDGSAAGGSTTFSAASQDFVLSGVVPGDLLTLDFIPLVADVHLDSGLPVVGLAGKTLVYSLEGGTDRTVTFVRDDVSLDPADVSRSGVLDQINNVFGFDVVSIASVGGDDVLSFVSDGLLVIRSTGTGNAMILGSRSGLPSTPSYDFALFDQDNTSPFAGVYAIQAVGTTLTIPPLPSSGDFTDPVADQQFTVSRYGSQRISTTEMGENTAEAGLYYFDVELVSEGTGDQYNIDSDQQLLASGYRSDGWYLTTDNENLTFSMLEKVNLVLSKSILESGVDDDPSNATILSGQNMQISYERSQLTEDVNNFVIAETERNVCSSPMARHLLPNFVRFDLRYTGGSQVDIVKADIENYISDLFPADPLESSDLQKIVSGRGATSITNPIDMISVVHGVDRTVQATRSQDAIVTGRLSSYTPDVLNITRNN